MSFVFLLDFWWDFARLDVYLSVIRHEELTLIIDLIANNIVQPLNGHLGHLIMNSQRIQTISHRSHLVHNELLRDTLPVLHNHTFPDARIILRHEHGLVKRWLLMLLVDSRYELGRDLVRVKDAFDAL